MPTSNLPAAVGAWQAGKRAEAERLARASVDRDPSHVDAHRLLQEIFTASGRFSEAIAVARRVIELAPRDAAAHRRLAELLSRGGDAAAAVAMLERSLELEPDHARALNNLGNWLTGLGRAEEAIPILTRALARQPEYPAALVNLGRAYARTGLLERSIDCYRRALALHARFPEALVNLAAAYGRMNQPEAALACYAQANAVQRPDADTLTRMGQVLLMLKRYDEAAASFDSALREAPDHAAASLGRAAAMLGRKRPDAALIACDEVLARDAPPSGARGLRATALLALDRVPEALQAALDAAAADPDDAQTFITLGFAALAAGTPARALSAFNAAARIAPGIAKVHAGRANALDSLGRAADAIDAYHEAARLDPGDPHVFLSSGQMMLRLGNGASALAAFDAVLGMDRDHVLAQEGRAKALVALGRHEEALRALTDLKARAPRLEYLPGYLFHMQLCCCDWRDFESTRQEITDRVCRAEPVAVPLCFLAYSTEPDQQRICAQVYASAQCAVAAPRVSPSAPSVRRRLRVAYLSADFRHHPVAQLTVGLFESHDRTRFDIYGLCSAPDDGSDLRRRLVAAFDHFEDVSTLSDEAVAGRIAALDIDILVDLGGHTFGSRTRVLAYRPAVVQIAFLGYPGTLGAEFVDYLVADRHVVPDAERIHYSEQVIYLPDSFMPMDFRGILPPPPEKGAVGLPEDAFVYCAFNAAFKITPPVFDRWMRVLGAVPTAVLWLREGTGVIKSNLAREAGARGVDPARLIYAPRVPRVEDYLARFALADVFLDTAPYNAHTTAGEALAAGVPVVTARGRTFASRVATSLLHAVDLGHLSVDTPAGYERLAIDLAHSPASLAALKAHLRSVSASAPLFDTVRFCRHLEDGFLAVAARASRGERPATLQVERRP
ncbi:MAG: tetratricopeptide repeat protein [Steroidobacteraceae bacterium]